ncbi:MAG: hypothetical protein ACPL6D_01980 [Thermodesulfobacteriota bacterium]
MEEILQRPEGGLEMYFRIYCSAKEIEAPDLETAERMIKESLKKYIWLIPITETPFAPPAKEPEGPKPKEKRGGHGSMTFRH